MTYKTISEFKVGETIDGFYLIKSIECKTSSNNKKYLDITLADKTGEINAKLWDCSQEDELKYFANMLVKIRGSVSEWQGKYQLKIDKVRFTCEDDGLSIEDFVPSAPLKPEYMFNEIMEYVDKMQNTDLQNIVKLILDISREKLMTFPAAKKNHHAIRSGLLYHIYRMLVTGDQISLIYNNINRDLLFAGIILHDIAKLDEMEASSLGIVSDYTIEGNLLGHIIQGIKLIDKATEKVGAHKEAALMLEHMLLSHHYHPEFGSPKKPMFPEAELLHYIDMIDARMYTMEQVIENTEAGGFSERVWELENRVLYKSNILDNNKITF